MVSIWQVLAVVVAVLYLVQELHNIFVKKKKKLPLGPKGFPIIGNLHMVLGKNLHQALHHIAKKHGPIMSMRFGLVPVIVASSPYAAEQFLKKHDITFASRPYNTAAQYIAYDQRDMVFEKYGPHWRNMRKLCTIKLLSNIKIDSFRSMRKQELGILVNFLKQAAFNHAEILGLKRQENTMGGGGNMSSPTTKNEQKKSHLERVPSSKPPFTLGDIKKAIPPHCFQRSLIRSFSYLIQDLILVSIFYYVANTYFHLLPSPLTYLAWPAYWIAQGCVCTGIWVIGHECGHHGFSDYQWVDDTVGLILHSALLTPYFAWKHSHRRHHANTGSLENDEVYIPRFKSTLRWYYKYLNNPLGRVFVLAFTLTFAWPLYLVFNISGKKYEGFACHYDPNSPIYSNREKLQIYISDAGVIAATYVLYRLAMTQGLTWVLCIYGVPLLIVNGFIVLITLLHHTHASLPHYDSSEWDYLRGALATVDRDYGILNKVFHNVTDTHVLHHIFSYISHYHAMELTNAIKPLLGEYYQVDDTPILKAMWRDTKECIYVEKEEGSQGRGVYWYKNKL